MTLINERQWIKNFQKISQQIKGSILTSAQNKLQTVDSSILQFESGLRNPRGICKSYA